MRYRSSHWLYDTPQCYEDRNISNVPIASILYLGNWYIGRVVLGSGAHHRLSAEGVGRNRFLKDLDDSFDSCATATLTLVSFQYCSFSVSLLPIRISVEL